MKLQETLHPESKSGTLLPKRASAGDFDSPFARSDGDLPLPKPVKRAIVDQNYQQFGEFGLKWRAASGRRRRMMAVSERVRSPKELLGRISRRLPAPRPCFPVPPAARVALVVLVFFQVSSAF